MYLNKIMIGIGILLIVFIPIWIFFIVPELLKMPGDYSNVIVYKRLSNINHEIGGEWTGEQLIKGESIEKTIRIDKNIQVIEGNYIAKSLDGINIWNVKKEYGIDRKTRKVIPGYGQNIENSYFYFPPNLNKQTYDIWITQYLYPIKLNFKGIENIQGLEAYKFEAKNFIFDDSEGFEWLELVPEVYNILADGTVNVWVEPITGIILDFKGGGVAYYADKQTGEKIQDMQTWSNEYSMDSIVNQVRLAQNEKQKIYLIEYIIPILLALIGLAFIFSSFIGRKFIGNENNISLKSKPVKKNKIKKSPDKSKKPLITFPAKNN